MACRRSIRLTGWARNIIVLDLNMPGLDGYGVLSHLRSRPATAGIPVIVLTAKSDEDNEGAGVRAGRGDFLTKPFRARACRHGWRRCWADGAEARLEPTFESTSIDTYLCVPAGRDSRYWCCDARGGALSGSWETVHGTSSPAKRRCRRRCASCVKNGPEPARLYNVSRVEAFLQASDHEIVLIPVVRGVVEARAAVRHSGITIAPIGSRLRRRPQVRLARSAEALMTFCQSSGPGTRRWKRSAGMLAVV